MFLLSLFFNGILILSVSGSLHSPMTESNSETPIIPQILCYYYYVVIYYVVVCKVCLIYYCRVNILHVCMSY